MRSAWLLVALAGCSDRAATKPPPEITPAPASRAARDHAAAKDREPLDGAQLRANCDSNDLVSCYELGMSMLRGCGNVAKDPSAAIPVFEKNCTGGHDTSCEVLGLAYQEGEGVKKDPARARAFAAKACSLGHDEACANP